MDCFVASLLATTVIASVSEAIQCVLTVYRRTGLLRRRRLVVFTP